MPTERPRLTITETDHVAEAIDLGAERWPETPSRRGGDERDELAERREAIRRTSGAVTGIYEPEYLGRIRDDRPA